MANKTNNSSLKDEINNKLNEIDFEQRYGSPYPEDINTQHYNRNARLKNSYQTMARPTHEALAPSMSYDIYDEPRGWVEPSDNKPLVFDGYKYHAQPYNAQGKRVGGLERANYDAYDMYQRGITERPVAMTPSGKMAYLEGSPDTLYSKYKAAQGVPQGLMKAPMVAVPMAMAASGQDPLTNYVGAAGALGAGMANTVMDAGMVAQPFIDYAGYVQRPEFEDERWKQMQMMGE